MANVQRFWPSQKVSNWLSAGIAWSGSTANGLATYGSSSSIVAESNATYDGTDLTLTSGNLIVSSGYGIDFSATSHATGMTSELLDDYEEGTWTAAFATGTSGTIVPNAAGPTPNATMNYTKIGRLVNVSGNVDGFTVSSPVGTLTMTGLPFAIADTPERSDRGTFSVTAMGLVSGEVGIFGWYKAGTDGLEINYGNGTTTNGGTSMADQIDAGSHIRINATYVAAT